MNYASNQVGIVSCDSYLKDNISASLDRLFDSLGMDIENPFKDIVKPGMRVFIKPNWVASRWRESCPHKDDLYCVITHPNVIEEVADRVAVALEGKGEIIIADNPSIDADFEELMHHTGIKWLENKYDVPCHIYDLRPLICPSLDVYGKRDKMIPGPGDPNGETVVNIGKDSLLYEVDPTLFRGVFDEREETVASHTGDTQLYTYANSLYLSDVYISIPKLKTHQKVGATLNMKGLVGTVTNKNQLVHWKVGIPETGGDEYPDKKSYDEAYRTGKLHRGSWPGNDTIWRMVVDLYKGLKLRERKYFSIIDGIMAGEGQGPFCPTAKYADTLIGGEDFLLTDIVACRYMGLDPCKLKYLNYFIQEKKLELDNDIEVCIEGKNMEKFFSSNTRYKDFSVTPLWEAVKFEMK